MWLIKLPFRIIALPIMAIVAVFSIFYSLALNLSAMVVGLLYLVLVVCICDAFVSTRLDLCYPTFLDKLLHLFYCSCKFHCFCDGNKRIAITLTAMFFA